MNELEKETGIEDDTNEIDIDDFRSKKDKNIVSWHQVEKTRDNI